MRQKFIGRGYVNLSNSARCATAMLVICTMADAAEPALTTAQQVLELGVESARRLQPPVRLQGLVTYPEPGAGMIYVQDSSAGIRVLYTNANYQPASGQLVIVEGTAAGATFAPYVDKANVRVQGFATIPEPCEAPAARMAAGELSGQWVQVEGVVRDVAKEPERAQFFISSGGVRFHAVVQPFPGADLPVDWLDARVVLRGVCWTDVDAESKPTGFTLYVPGTNHVFSLHRGMADPFNQPALPLSHSELRRQSDTRVKVAGTVTYHSPGGHIYLQDGKGVLHARLLVPLPRNNPAACYYERPPIQVLTAGERVELLGAPTTASFAPFLQDAEFRRLESGTAPAPTAVSADQIFSGQYDGQLVSIKGRLLARESRHFGGIKHEVLAVQTGNTIFEALWEFTGSNALPAIAKNSYIQAAGVCAVELGELNHIRAFRVLLRDASDLRLLGKPPWWEPLPVGKILAGTAILGTAALIGMWVLRRQVSERTAELRAEVAERQKAQTELRHALEAERELGELRSRFVSMVSHEFRTPLGVILSAAENLDSYFDRLKPDQRETQLHHISQATRHMAKLMEEVLLLARAEAGKLEFKPAPVDLVAFCERIISQVQSATAGRCPIQFRAGPLPPACGDEAFLRHILTNLLTNGVKYSGEGSPVELIIEQHGENAVFRVKDNGIGIPVTDQKQLFTAFYRGRNATHLPGSGLGLVIVKRCVELHGGHVACESTEGKGTTFTVRLPLFEAGAETAPATVRDGREWERLSA